MREVIPTWVLKALLGVNVFALAVLGWFVADPATPRWAVIAFVVALAFVPVLGMAVNGRWWKTFGDNPWAPPGG